MRQKKEKSIKNKTTCRTGRCPGKMLLDADEEPDLTLLPRKVAGLTYEPPFSAISLCKSSTTFALTTQATSNPSKENTTENSIRPMLL